MALTTTTQGLIKGPKSGEHNVWGFSASKYDLLSTYFATIFNFSQVQPDPSLWFGVGDNTVCEQGKERLIPRS